MTSELETEGRHWLRGAVGPAELREIERAAAHTGRPGARSALGSRLGKSLSNSGLTLKLQSIWPGMQPVRIVSFDKSAGSNWGVPWHQDRVIAVDRRFENDGYSNWTEKDDVWHCEPPIELLWNMLFVRLHIDASTAANGAMEIALQSHKAGKVSADAAHETAAQHQTELTLAEPGDVLVLPMLTLHRSAPARSIQGRRVLRVDYSAQRLPEPLQWAR